MSKLNERFEAWWRRQGQGLPLMYVVAVDENAPRTPHPLTPRAYLTDADYLVTRTKNEIAHRTYFAAP